MSFISVLSTIGKDIGKVFAFIGAPKTQAVIGVVEGVAEDVFPQLTGLINLTRVRL